MTRGGVTGTQENPIPSSRLRRWGFLALFLAACVSAANMQRSVDPDLFWHLRAGADILGAGRVVLPDSWNYLFAGSPWVNQQWLVQVLLCLAFRWGGFGGLVVLKDLAALGVAGLILSLFRGKGPVVGYACAGLFFAMAAQDFLFRPRVFSFLGMAALLFLLERVPPARRLPWLLLLFALWANVHAFFGLGLGVLGCYALVRWLQRGRAFGADTLWEWASVPLASLATLLNPFGLGVWKTAFSAFGSRETYLVTEWFPIWRHSLVSSLPFLAFALLLALLLWLFPRAVHWPGLVTAAVFFALTVTSVRFAADFYLVALPLAGALAGAAAAALPPRLRERAKGLLPGLCAAFVGIVALSLSLTLARPIVLPEGDSRSDFPARAARWMAQRGMAGKVFTEYSWGGFVLWEQRGSRVNIDGRTNVLLFPPGHMAGWSETVSLGTGWRERFENGRPDFALLYRDDLLGHRLEEDPAWQVLFRDDLSVLLGHSGP